MPMTLSPPQNSERKTIFSVTEITLLIKKNLEEGFGSITIKGEISNFKLHTSGHAYFTLKDHTAQISAVMFKGSMREGFRLPKDGDEVICTGELSVYPQRGNYQILVKQLTSAGIGQMLLKFQALKEKLEALGYFSHDHKKKLPKFPKVIGVVTSPTGSVLQDILRVLSRRFPQFHLILSPVKVQGDGAAQEISKAIYDMNLHKLCDVMIIGRGGGSLEDLWAFNEEIVAKAIYDSKIPIISAVGHETDVTISDFVADVRAPTPSAAAEIAIGPLAEQLEFLNRCEEQLFLSVERALSQTKQKLKWFLSSPAFSSSVPLLALPIQRLDSLYNEMDQRMWHAFSLRKEKIRSLENRFHASSPFSVIALQKKKIDQFKELFQGALARTLSLDANRKKLLQLEKEILASLKRIFEEKREKVLQLKSHLFSLHPEELLKQGYCILFRENSSSIILSAGELSPKDRISVRLFDGSIAATVDLVNKLERK